MNISKKAKSILLTCSAFLVLSAGIFTAVHFSQTNREIPTEEKPVITSYACWPEYHIDNATEDAVTIVYGIAGPLGETQIHEAHTSDGEIYQEYHRPVEIQVIQMMKGDMDAETITYLDPGGETEDAVYEFDGVAHVVEGQAYLFFLNQYGTFLNPATCLPVEEDGTIIPYWDMRIENEAQARSNESLPFSIEDYLAEVQKNLD
ncbi:MAG: hypothetical protein HFJ86_00410 [Oscillospiraceae bacterium]|jgi:hypothetical protein|nr:hypothetical protein [Oscillospiraceae bacterium]